MNAFKMNHALGKPTVLELPTVLLCSSLLYRGGHILTDRIASDNLEFHVQFACETGSSISFVRANGHLQPKPNLVISKRLVVDLPGTGRFVGPCLCSRYLRAGLNCISQRQGFNDRGRRKYKNSRLSTFMSSSDLMEPC